MRKNRNTFFAESNANYQGYNPMAANGPYQASNYSNSFYAGPIPNDYNDISQRLAKIERQISRIEHRLNKLEANNVKSTDDFEETTNNMYMI